MQPAAGPRSSGEATDWLWTSGLSKAEICEALVAQDIPIDKIQELFSKQGLQMPPPPINLLSKEIDSVPPLDLVSLDSLKNAYENAEKVDFDDLLRKLAEVEHSDVSAQSASEGPISPPSPQVSSGPSAKVLDIVSKINGLVELTQERSDIETMLVDNVTATKREFDEAWKIYATSSASVVQSPVAPFSTPRSRPE